MKFLIDLLKRAPKGDNFRAPATSTKYNDKIAQLNALSPNQYDKINVSKLDSLSKTQAALTQTTTSNTTIPGSR
jgi:ribosomal protein L18E